MDSGGEGGVAHAFGPAYGGWVGISVGADGDGRGVGWCPAIGDLGVGVVGNGRCSKEGGSEGQGMKHHDCGDVRCLIFCCLMSLDLWIFMD